MPDDTATRLEAALNAQAAAHPPVLTDPGTSDPRPGEHTVTIAPIALRPSRRRAGVTITAAVVGVAAVAAATIAFTNLGPTSGHGSVASVNAGDSSPAPRPHVSATPVPAGPTPVGTAAGQKLLARAASSRATAGDPTVRPGQFLLQRTVSAAAPVIYEGKTIRKVKAPAGAFLLDRTWRPADQNDVWTRQQQTVGFPLAGTGVSRWAGVCDDLYQDTQDPPAGSGCGRPGSFEDTSPDFVSALPRDPSALYAQLRAYAQGEVNPEKIHSVDALVVMTIVGLFDSDAVPADLASSLIKALALVPSIHVVRNVSTFTGRVGFGVQVSHVDGSGRRATQDTEGIILDPRTGAYLGSYSGRPGSTRYGSADVSMSVVDRVPAGH